MFKQFNASHSQNTCRKSYHFYVATFTFLDLSKPSRSTALTNYETCRECIRDDYVCSDCSSLRVVAVHPSWTNSWANLFTPMSDPYNIHGSDDQTRMWITHVASNSSYWVSFSYWVRSNSHTVYGTYLGMHGQPGPWLSCALTVAQPLGIVHTCTSTVSTKWSTNPK